MPLHSYSLSPAGLTRTSASAATLDALSLTLPDGVYTTLRTYAGDRVVGLSAHLRRLADSHTLLGRRPALPVDLAALRAALRSVLAAEAAEQPGDFRLRLTVPFAGDQVFIAAEPFVAYPAELYSQGVRCATIHLERPTPLAKSTAFIAPSRSAKAERDPAFHELLRVDAQGRLLEGTTSNFFAVLAGELRTAAAGILEGVTRQVVLAQAAGLVPVRLEPAAIADFPRLTEAFITSASREVMPVVAIDGAPVGSGRPGPVTVELLARYRAHLRETSEAP